MAGGSLGGGRGEKQKMDEAVRHEKVEDCAHLLSYADKSRGSCGEGFRWLRLGLM